MLFNGANLSAYFITEQCAVEIHSFAKLGCLNATLRSHLKIIGSQADHILLEILYLKLGIRPCQPEPDLDPNLKISD